MSPHLIVDVKDSLLYFLVDLLGGVDEGLLHVGGGLRRGLHEDQAVLPRERLAFLFLHFPPGFQVTAWTVRFRTITNFAAM